MSPEPVAVIAASVCVGGLLNLGSAMRRQRFELRSLNKKLDALLKKQGIEWPSLSPEVQRLALDSTKRIAAIKLHRDQNPGMGLAEAKMEVDAFVAGKH